MTQTVAGDRGGPGWGRDRVRVMTGLTTPRGAGRNLWAGPAPDLRLRPRRTTWPCTPALYQAPARHGAGLRTATGSTRVRPCFGELMATGRSETSGWAGLVLQGPIRGHRRHRRTSASPVWCTGTAPGQAAKAAVVSVGLPVVVGGVLVAPGDQVIGRPATA